MPRQADDNSDLIEAGKLVLVLIAAVILIAGLVLTLSGVLDP